MKKKLISKLILIIFTSITFFIFIFNSNVNAANIENENYTLEEFLNSEEKIMMYDAKTGETTEVNTEELKQNINSSEDASILKPYTRNIYQSKFAFNSPLRLRFRFFCRKST